MFNAKTTDSHGAMGPRYVATLLLVALTALPVGTRAESLAGQLLVSTGARTAADGSSKPHSPLAEMTHSKMLRDGQQSAGWQLWQLPEGSDSAKVAMQLNDLYANGAGSIAEPNRSRLPQLYNRENFVDGPLQNPNAAALQQLHLTEAWKITKGHASVVVAVIDDGVDWQHPGLRHQIWRNTNEIAGDGVDNDQNGFVDDIRGWNFRDGNNDPGYQSNINGNGHGTLVAGAIAGNYVGNTGTKVAIGSAPDVRIMPLRISHDSHSLLRALDYAANNHADIVNISLGGILPSVAEEQAIAQLRDRGILLVAAAGNHHNNNDFRGIYPASYTLPNILSVAAQDTNAAITEWSQYGSSSVDIAAPGVNLVSTARGGNYVSASGTSLAAGYAAGVAALIKSQYPDNDYRAIKARLLVSATPMDPHFVTSSDSAVNAAASLLPRSAATFSIRNLSSTSAGTQRELHIELEPYFTDILPPSLLSATLHCANYADGNSIAVQLVSHINNSLIYRVAPTVSSSAADLRCELSLTDDKAFTTQRRFRITDPRRLPLNRVIQATFQTSDQDDYQHWMVEIPAGTNDLELFVRSEKNIDVLLRPTEAPRYIASLGVTSPTQPFLLTDTDTSRSASSSGFERLRRSKPAAGSWHIVVLNQQQQPNTRYTIEVTADGSTSSERAATPANQDSIMAVQSRSEISNESGGGGVMFWMALLISTALRRHTLLSKK